MNEQNVSESLKMVEELESYLAQSRDYEQDASLFDQLAKIRGALRSALGLTPQVAGGVTPTREALAELGAAYFGEKDGDRG